MYAPCVMRHAWGLYGKHACWPAWHATNNANHSAKKIRGKVFKLFLFVWGKGSGGGQNQLLYVHYCYAMQSKACITYSYNEEYCTSLLSYHIYILLSGGDDA